MPVTVTRQEDRIIAAIEGEIDHHNAKSIRETIDEAALRMKPAVTVLDFGGVSFMDSSGIGLIMGRFKLMRELGGRVEITNTSRPVARMIRLAGIGKLGIVGASGEEI